MHLVFFTLAFPALMCVARVAQATNQHMICKTVENVFDDGSPASTTPRSHANQGPPGKRGSPGVKGERGMLGPEGQRGLPGIVDYQIVENVSEEKVAAGTEGVRAEMQKLQDINSTLEDRLCRHGGGFVYSGKCYFAAINNAQEVTFGGGYSDCLNRGGKPANVMSTDHQTEITNYLRTKIPFSRNNVWVWLGMTYKGNKLLFSDGTAAPVLTWYPGHPSSGAGIGIQADRNPSSPSQGLFTMGRSNNQWGVLCEK